MENGTNVIIIAILLVFLAIGAVYTVRHFRKKSGCCGGGGYRLPPKKLTRVGAKTEFRVLGMTCEHCKGRVTEAVNDHKGARAKVDLRRGTVTVEYEGDAEDEAIRARIERAGYQVEGFTSLPLRR